MAQYTIAGSAAGFPAQYGQHIQNAWSNNQGDSVVVTPEQGNTLVAVVFGLKSFNPFDLMHTGNTNYAWSPDLLSFAATPVVRDSSAPRAAAITEYDVTDNLLTLTVPTHPFLAGEHLTLSGFATATFLNGQEITIKTVIDASHITADFTHANGSATEAGMATRTASNTWTAAAGKVVLGGADYTASLGDFSRSAKWALDGKFPCVYIFYALNVNSGTYKVTVNSCYQDGTTRPADLAAGKPIFDGGVDIHVFEVRSTAKSAASDGSTGQMSAANPAVAPSFVTNLDGDIIITAGLMKSGNAFSHGTGAEVVAAGKCVNSQAHWAIQWQRQATAGAIAPGFVNPLGYEMAVASLALKSAIV